MNNDLKKINERIVLNIVLILILGIIFISGASFTFIAIAWDGKLTLVNSSLLFGCLLLLASIIFLIYRNSVLGNKKLEIKYPRPLQEQQVGNKQIVSSSNVSPRNTEAMIMVLGFLLVGIFVIHVSIVIKLLMLVISIIVFFIYKKKTTYVQPNKSNVSTTVSEYINSSTIFIVTIGLVFLILLWMLLRSLDLI